MAADVPNAGEGQAESDVARVAETANVFAPRE